MAASAPEPRERPAKPSRKGGFSKHPTLLGKIGHAGFHFSRHTLRLFGILLGLILLIVIASLFVDEPMRRAMERSMNEHLTGYNAKIRDLDFHLIGFSVTLHDVSIRQEAHPEPAVAVIPRLRASVQWSELVKLKLVSDFQIDQPKVYLNLTQLRQENSDDVPVQKRGWQQALEDIYPLKINLLQINDGSFTYIDTDPKRPLTLTHLFVQANNIRNIRSPERVYPSPVHAEGIVFGTGRAEVDGHANFLAEPYAGVNTIFTLEKVPLDYFRPMLSRAHLSIRDGFLSSHGRVEYAPTVKVAHVEDLVIDRVRLDYVHSASSIPDEGKVQKAVRKASDEPGLLLRLDQFRLTNSNVGWINRRRAPDYRVFVSGANVNVTNLSNQFKDGPARATLTGKFMGSGATSARATYRPEKSGPDFDPGSQDRGNADDRDERHLAGLRQVRRGRRDAVDLLADPGEERARRRLRQADVSRTSTSTTRSRTRRSRSSRSSTRGSSRASPTSSRTGRRTRSSRSPTSRGRSATRTRAPCRSSES